MSLPALASRTCMVTLDPMLLNLPGRRPAKGPVSRPGARRPPKLSPGRLLGALALAGTGAAVSACGGRTVVQPSAETEAGIVDLTNPAAPIPTERFLKPEVARIAPGDQLFIKALSYDELNVSVTVAQDGRINLSLLGSVEAGGRTLTELDDELTQAYSSYFRNFDLAVLLVESAPRTVYVLGQVRSGGGRFQFLPGDRVLHAVALAGGMLDTARENGVILVRRDPGGPDHAYRLDFSHIHHKLAPQDIYLQPGDVVYVPKSRFRTFTDFAKEFLDVVQRATVSTLLIDDLLFRERVQSISVGR